MGGIGADQHVPNAMLESGGQVWGQSQSEHRVAWPSSGPGSTASLSAKTSLLPQYYSTGQFTAYFG